MRVAPGAGLVMVALLVPAATGQDATGHESQATARSVVPIEQIFLLDGALALSVGVRAPAFDGECGTGLSATVEESASTVAVRVTATGATAEGCPPELRRIVVDLARYLGDRTVVDASSGEPVPLGGIGPQGEHPGDPSIPFDRARLSGDGTSLTLHFNGSASDSGPCGVRYAGTVREAADRVEVRVRGEATGDRHAICAGIAGPRSVTVRLAQPLGDRPLHDAAGRRLTPTR